MSELHFVRNYEAVKIVEASDKEEALDKARCDETDRVTHVGTESNIKDHLKDNEVVHL